MASTDLLASADSVWRSRVLVVEDDTGLQRLIRRTLEKAGFEIETAGSGGEAIERLRENPSMVLLLDQKLPDMNGRDVIHELERDGARIPFVVMTGQGDERLAVEMMKLGAADYLVKDLDFIDLLPGVLEKLLRTLDTERKLQMAQEELRDSEELFHSVFEFHAAVKLLIDSETGCILDANRAASEFYGWPVARLRQMNIREINTSTSERVKQEMTLAATGGKSTFEFKHRLADGSIRDVNVFSSLIKPKGRAILHSIIQDVTEQKHAEQQLRRSRDLVQSMFRVAPIGIAILQNGVYIEINPRFSEITGFEQNALLYGDSRLLFPSEEDFRNTEADCLRQFAENGFAILETRIRRQNGEIRYVLWASTQMDPEVEEGGVIVTILDITGRIQAEEALRFSEERFRSMAEQSNDLISLTDDEGRIIYASPQMFKLFGYEPEEAIGLHFSAFLDEDEVARALEAFRGTVNTGGDTIALELKAKRKDGSTFCCELNGARFQTENLRGSLVNIRDITERLHAEEERAWLQTQLTQAQKMESVGRLAGGVAHDFNNILTVILCHAELALQQLKPGIDFHTDFNEIRKAAERASDLTRQLLAFARKQTVTPKLLDLNDTVEGMLKMLRRLIGEDIDLMWAPCSEAGSVKMDPSQIDQILANLCVNARDAIAGPGKIVIETEPVSLDDAWCQRHPGSAPGEYMMLSVADNGCGMDQETLGRVFEPFFTTKEMGKGTGLGLATVYGIVKQNNGFISVDSELEKGSTFRVYLPREREAFTQARYSGLGHLRQGTETILIVEDEPSILKMIGLLLDNLGYKVYSAPSPREALDIAREHGPEIELLMTDVIMPGMNGRELADILSERIPTLKRLFMSGYTADVIAQHGVLNEGTCFLEKPFSAESLASKVREALGDPGEDQTQKT
jgi:two-component system, cell cycle sensor histidine kinase and response regulator CckA